jgi:hypothetical protein
VSGHELLFYTGDLGAALEEHGRGVVREIESVDEAHLMQVDEEQWVEALVDRYQVALPQLDGRSAWMDEPQPAQVDVSWDHFRRAIDDPSQPTYVPGHRTVVHIPFTGDKAIFHLRASRFSSNPPRADVAAGELRLVVEYPDDAPADINAKTQQLISSVERHLGFARNDIEQFNSGLASQARAAIAARRERVRRHTEHLAATGLPIGPSGARSKTYIAKSIVRRPAPVLPATPSQQPISLEPVLADEVYDHILSVIRMSALGMERSPKTYRGMGEEARRQVILDALNTHYRGEGTAEAFNVSGKTDILVRHEGSNLFIGECKFWTGAKGFTETIDQLFGYRAWRDTKLAILMFVRERQLTSIIERGHGALSQHPQFVHWQQAANETELRATVSWTGDHRRHADLNVFFISTPPK